MANMKQTVLLLPAEQLLREFLLECALHFPGLEIWIAGGWVRDRLLGIPSSDLDLALSNVTGREFGKYLESFSAEPDIESKYCQKVAGLGIAGSRFTKFHIMEKNVGMSKNLETAGGKLFGLDIDLVNLRKEVYDGQSRTPHMEFGTPEEDAFRRDATVNSLFFHLEKQEIVDLTGRGLKDLNARIMATPLDPHQTFMDDPLRVLRFIRIGSKLGFSIEPEAMRCVKDREIRRALDTIITRDRIGIELFKMMTDPDPAVAFQLIFELNLYSPVFLRLDSPLLQTLQTDFLFLEPLTSPKWPITWPRAYQLLTALLKDRNNLGTLVQSETNLSHLWIMAAYAPIAGLRQTMLRQAVLEATAAIRAPAKVSKLLESALKNFDSIHTTVNSIVAETGKSPLRSLIGMAIRSWGATWIGQVTYVMLAQVVYANEMPSTSVSSTNSSLIDESTAGTILGRYSAFADFVCENDLRDAHLQRPLLNGNLIQSLFGLQRGGNFLKTAIDELMAWQFDHTNSSVEEAEAWLLSQQERIGIPMNNETWELESTL